MINSMDEIILVMSIVSAALTALTYQTIFLFLNNRKAVRVYLEHQRGRQVGGLGEPGKPGVPGSGSLEEGQTLMGTSPWDGQG